MHIGISHCHPPVRFSRQKVEPGKVAPLSRFGKILHSERCPRADGTPTLAMLSCPSSSIQKRYPCIPRRASP